VKRGKIPGIFPEFEQVSQIIDYQRLQEKHINPILKNDNQT